MDLGKGLGEYAGRVALILGGFGAIVMVAYSVLHPQPPVPKDFANGLYSNPACGSIAFQNGVVTVANQRVQYSLERDKKGGVFADPEYFVGVANSNGACKLVTDRKRSVQSLDFGQESGSDVVTIWDRDRVATYDFVREGSAR